MDRRREQETTLERCSRIRPASPGNPSLSSPQVQQHTMMSSPSPVQVPTPQMPPPPQPSPQPPTSQPNSARYDRCSDPPGSRPIPPPAVVNRSASSLQFWTHSVSRWVPAQPVPSALPEPGHLQNPPELRRPLTWTAQHSR